MEGSTSMAQGLLGRSVLDWPTGVTVYEPEKCFNGYTLYPSRKNGVGSRLS